MGVSKHLERNQSIITRIIEGEKQVDIAKDLGISRERIRQIYKRHAQIPYKAIQKKRQEIKRFERKKQLRATIKYYCLICDKPVHLLEGKRRAHGWKYCRECRDKALFYVSQECDLCRKFYYPNRVKQYQESTLSFCSKDCYFNFLHAYKKSIYRIRLRESHYRERLLEDKIETLERRLNIVRIPKIINRIKHKTKIERVSKEDPLPKNLEGRCRKCTMVLTGEFENFKSSVDPTVCIDCTGESYNYDETSLVNSGVIKAK